MKLKDYIKNLNLFVIEHPEALKLDVIFSCDEEGNHFERVSYGPNIGVFGMGEFMPSDTSDKDAKPNAVCIN